MYTNECVVSACWISDLGAMKGGAYGVAAVAPRFVMRTGLLFGRRLVTIG